MAGHQISEFGGFKPNGASHQPSTPASSESVNEILELPTALLFAGASQPRSHFDADSLEALASSIRHCGILQPIIVKSATGGRYEIIAGERRWRASQLAGLKTIPCILKKESKNNDLEDALVENIQREDLTPIEEARALATLIREYQLTQDALSERLGIPRTTVANLLRLLQLPDNIKEMIDSGKLSLGHGKALLMVNNPAAQIKLAQLVVAKGLSVRKTEELAKAIDKEKDSHPRQIEQISPNLRHLCDQYKGHLGTKVKIAGDQQRGRIEISYYSSEDLDRITELVLGSGGL